MDLRYLNIALETTCFLFSFGLLMSLVVAKSFRSKLSKILVFLLATNCFTLLFDASAWFFCEKDGEVIHYIVTASNYLSFVFSYMQGFLTALYLVTYVSIKKQDTGKLYLISYFVFFVIATILATISLFNGMLFSVSPRNIVVAGEYYWITSVYSLLATLSLLLFIVCYKKIFVKGDFYVMILSLSFILVAAIIEGFIIDLMLFYVMYTVTLAIFLITIQLQQEIEFNKRELILKSEVMFSQIQPHFLYNSLTAIESLCDTDPIKVKPAISSFAHYLRGNLDYLSQRNFISFTEELNHIKNYIMLEKLRFEDKLTIKYDLQIEEFMLPPLTVQPIVENAIKHGITEKEDRGIIIISTKKVNDKIEILIIDDGVGFGNNFNNHSKDGAGIGISNVRGRLFSMCKGTLEIDNQEDIGTTVKILIPYLKKEEILP